MTHTSFFIRSQRDHNVWDLYFTASPGNNKINYLFHCRGPSAEFYISINSRVTIIRGVIKNEFWVGRTGTERCAKLMRVTEDLLIRRVWAHHLMRKVDRDRKQNCRCIIVSGNNINTDFKDGNVKTVVKRTMPELRSHSYLALRDLRWIILTSPKTYHPSVDRGRVHIDWMSTAH